MLALIIIAGIYSGFSLLTFIMAVTQVYVVGKELEREYSDVLDVKFYKKNVLEKIFGWLKVFVACFVPIINIGIFYVSLFKNELIKDKALNKYSR